MNLQILIAFFMWCTIINAVILILSFLICAFGGDRIYQLHSKWFSMSREAFNTALYSLLGLYKIIFIVFNLVPYIALLIMKANAGN